MTPSTLVALATTLVIALAGCSNPKEASEKNFEVAIQRYLDVKYPQCVFSHNFPADTSGFSIGNSYEMLEELTKLGFLDKSEEMRKPNAYKHSKPVKINVYSINNEGLKVATNNNKDKNVTYYNFCVGKAKVEEIVDFTEPTGMLGQTISRVSFTYSVSDLPGWAKTTELVKLNDGLKEMVEAAEKPKKETGVLLLTNKGWKHIDQDRLDDAKAKVAK